MTARRKATRCRALWTFASRRAATPWRRCCHHGPHEDPLVAAARHRRARPAFGRRERVLLVKFDGGIGAIPISQGEGTAATATVVDRNNVRGVQAPGQPWAIAHFEAEVMVDGRIRADGRGLVFAGGNTIGTALVVTPTGGTAGLDCCAIDSCRNRAASALTFSAISRTSGPAISVSRRIRCSSAPSSFRAAFQQLQSL
jgi:hypothetical protein